MAKRNDCGRVGYEFEDTLKDVFTEIKRRYKFDFHRFSDTKAAGRYLAPQPGDFLISFTDDKSSNHAIIVEAKASEEHESLRSCAASAIRSEQMGKLRAWLRSGGQGQYWFYCESSGVVEVWPGRHVVEARAKSKPLDKSQIIATLDYLKLEEQLTTLFKIAK